MNEESGLPLALKLFSLDSVCMVPRHHFRFAAWPEDILVIPEFCFAVDATAHGIKLSKEHSEYVWAPYEMAMKNLKWDSNKNALWELNERIAKDRVPDERAYRSVAQTSADFWARFVGN